MGKNIQDNHVPGIRGKTLQGHNVMAGQFFRPRFLSGLRKQFTNSPCLFRQTVILLHITDERHALLIRKRTEFL